MNVRQWSAFQGMLRYVRLHWHESIRWFLLVLAAGPIGAFGSILIGMLWSAAHTLLSPTFVIGVAVVAIICTFLFIRSWYWRTVAADAQTRFNTALNVANRLIASDETLLQLLPGIITDRGRDASAKRVLQGYLRDSQRIFEESVSRATVLRPDSHSAATSSEHLRPWVSYQMPEDSLRHRKFYIGHDSTKPRGVAGKAFATQRVQIVHISHDASGHWRADDPDYQVFDTMRPFPPYQSFAAVPILGAVHECLGVVCFDSPSSTAFDFEGATDLLLALGNRIAAVIRIHEDFLRLNAS
jgi:hypothetical protein